MSRIMNSVYIETRKSMIGGLSAPCVEESATGTPRKKVFLNNANNNEAHTESKEK